MVNLQLMNGEGDAELALALTYTRPEHRPALAALLALDERLAAIVRTTREPIVGQMRLTWWHDALNTLDCGFPPAEPVLRALAQFVVPTVPGADLSVMIEGWEILLEPDVHEAAVLTYAERRGGTLFGAAAGILGNRDFDVRGAGRVWALSDLAAHVDDAPLRTMATVAARERFSSETWGRWPRSLRGLGALMQSALMDLDDNGNLRGHPARVWRLLRLRLTGY